MLRERNGQSVGRMDRLTGSLGATVTWFNRRTNDLLMRVNYALICKPT